MSQESQSKTEHIQDSSILYTQNTFVFICHEFFIFTSLLALGSDTSLSVPAIKPFWSNYCIENLQGKNMLTCVLH